MAKRILVVCVALAVAAMCVSCKQGTTEDAQKDLDGITKIYDGFYSTLESNKGNPEAGVKAAQKYVDEKKGELSVIAKRLNRNPKAIPLIEKFSQEMQEKSRNKGRELGVSYVKYKGELGNMMNEFAKAMGGQ